LKPVEWGAAGWESADAGRAQRYYGELTGLSAAKARAKIVEQLKESGDLVGDPRPITHAVKFYEKGDRPLEIVTSRQWFFKTIEFRDALLARGRELEWHPEYMQTRYENWVNGLTGDWCVSRQRFFGVPFPVWYPIDEQGRAQYDRAIAATPDRLPIDPSTDLPPGYRPEQRGAPGGFVGDPDIMDTWATSSVSPQTVCGWPDDIDLFARTFPMDMRPQAHDIIRTWLFSSVLRAHIEHDSLPWDQRRDLGLRHRSRPQENVEVQRQRRHADGAARGARIGCRALLGCEQQERRRHAVRHQPDADRPAAGDQDPQRVEIRALRIGARCGDRRGHRAGRSRDAAQPRRAGDGDDRGVHRLRYARALQRSETFFWRFCDDYLELVKGRRYGEQTEAGAGSANAALGGGACHDASTVSRRSCRS
jgi:valyl-tRNA synthetase